MQRDIDQIIERLTTEVSGIRVAQMKVLHPGADDDGLWFVNTNEHEETVQLESSSGNCPFLIESDFNDERFHASNIEEAIAKVKHLLI